MRRTGALLATLALVVVVAGCGSDPDLQQARGGGAERCDWTMAGNGLARTHDSGCARADAVGPDTVDRLAPVWTVETRAEVTSAPVVTDQAVYVGDWSGRLYALDRSTGKTLWTRDFPVHEVVYAGQIPASPTLTELGGEEVLVVASGRTVWVVRSADGEPIWDHVLGDPDDPRDPIQIEGSPAVADGLVVVPSDVHNDRDHRSGVVALDLDDGDVRWSWDPEQGRPSGGCGSVWGSPSVDVDDRLVVVGTGNCSRQESWTRYSEAVVGLDLDTGEPRWSYQPRSKVNNQDWDFAGAPNLFSIGDRKVAGLGSKDGTYYVVDRSDGELVWKREAVAQPQDADGFAFGGFIGATTVGPDTDGRLVVAGGTAVGDCPCEHAFDAATGEVLWQNPEPGGTYGASGSGGGLVFNAGIDQTLRAFDLATGEVLWEHQLAAISASGPAIAGDLVVIGVGFREPGSPGEPSGGVQAFRVLAEGEEPPTTTSTTVPQGPAVTALEPSDQACVGSPCRLDFTLKDPPAGRSPEITLEVTPDPFHVSVRGADLGPPDGWLAPDGPAHDDGATVYAVFISPRDDKPELGSVLCILDEAGACEADEIAIPADRFTRISVLALRDAQTLPTVQEGYDRLVTTHSLDPALVPAS